MPAPDVVNAADQLFAAIERGDESTLEQMFDDRIAVWRESIALRVCIVIKLNVDALIDCIDEYFDLAGLAPLLT